MSCGLTYTIDDAMKEAARHWLDGTCRIDPPRAGAVCGRPLETCCAISNPLREERTWSN